MVALIGGHHENRAWLLRLNLNVEMAAVGARIIGASSMVKSRIEANRFIVRGSPVKIPWTFLRKCRQSKRN